MKYEPYKVRNRADRERRIHLALQRVRKKSGLDLQVSMTLDGSRLRGRGYQFQATIEGVLVPIIEGVVPGAVAEHYLNGMEVLLELQRDKRRAEVTDLGFE